MTDREQADRRYVRRWWIGLTVSLLLVFLVNGYFFYLGTHNNPALVRADYYQQAVRYDEALADSSATRASGWSLRVREENPPWLALVDNNGTLLAITATVEWYRPNDPSRDRQIDSFSLPATCSLTTLTPGRWDLTVSIKGPDLRRLRWSKSLTIPDPHP